MPARKASKIFDESAAETFLRALEKVPDNILSLSSATSMAWLSLRTKDQTYPYSESDAIAFTRGLSQSSSERLPERLRPRIIIPEPRRPGRGGVSFRHPAVDDQETRIGFLNAVVIEGAKNGYDRALLSHTFELSISDLSKALAMAVVRHIRMFGKTAGGDLAQARFVLAGMEPQWEGLTAFTTEGNVYGASGDLPRLYPPDGSWNEHMPTINETARLWELNNPGQKWTPPSTPAGFISSQTIGETLGPGIRSFFWVAKL